MRAEKNDNGMSYLRKDKITRYEDKIIMDLIRLKLGRQNGISDREDGLRLHRGAWDNDTNQFYLNKGILKLFEEYFNDHKIVCTGWKGDLTCIILDKNKYKDVLWIKVNENISDWNDPDYMKHTYSAKFCTEWGDFAGFTTTEIIFNLIKICNSL